MSNLPERGSERIAGQPSRQEGPGASLKLIAGIAAGALFGASAVSVKVQYDAHERSQKTTLGQLRNAHEQDQSRIDALTKASDRLSGIAAALTGVSPETVSGIYLHEAESLPGYGQEVDISAKESLRAATVKIVTRPKNSNYPWTDNCTGLKVAVAGHSYVATARHCLAFKARAMNKGGGNPDSSVYFDAPAANVSNHLANEYAIQTIDENNVRGPRIPVTAVSQSGEADWALMQVAKTTASKGFDRLDPIDYRTILDTRKGAKLGQSAVVYSLPVASKGEVLEGRGVYLGTAGSVFANDYRTMTFIGLRNADTPDTDACNYGASGSTAMFADGQVTGPLSIRNNIKYAGTFSNYPDLSADQEIKNTLRIEQALKINLESFDTVCVYSFEQPSIADRLVHGFSVDVDKVINRSRFK